MLTFYASKVIIMNFKIIMNVKTDVIFPLWINVDNLMDRTFSKCYLFLYFHKINLVLSVFTCKYQH